MIVCAKVIDALTNLKMSFPNSFGVPDLNRYIILQMLRFHLIYYRISVLL